MGSPMYIAIDPGDKGGIAWAYTNPRVLAPEMAHSGSYRMPATKHDLAYALHHHICWSTEAFVWVEKVGEIRPGKGLGSQGKFAMHVGEINGILAALSLTNRYGIRVHVDHPLPNFWMRKLGSVPKGSEPGQVRARKNYIKGRMQERWPGHAITLATADALAMLTVMLDKEHPGGLV